MPVVVVVVGHRGRLWHGSRAVVARRDLAGCAGFVIHRSRIYTQIVSKNVVSIDIMEWKQQKNIPMAQNTSNDV